jgi:hypothetical protein
LEIKTFESFEDNTSDEKMCILDFITNSNSSKALNEKYQQFLMHKYKRGNVIYFNDNISMVGKRTHLTSENNLIATLVLDRRKVPTTVKNEWEAKSATFDFSSDDRERSSAEEDNEAYNSTCTLCTSSFTFRNTSQSPQSSK